jgi:hypothetical protein
MTPAAATTGLRGPPMAAILAAHRRGNRDLGKRQPVLQA